MGGRKKKHLIEQSIVVNIKTELGHDLFDDNQQVTID